MGTSHIFRQKMQHGDDPPLHRAPFLRHVLHVPLLPHAGGAAHVPRGGHGKGSRGTSRTRVACETDGAA